MDTALPQKFPFILDRNLAEAKCTENRVCTSCDKVVLGKKVICMGKYIVISINSVIVIYFQYFLNSFVPHVLNKVRLTKISILI